MTVFEDSAFDDHERVLFCHDEASGLQAIVAIHSTARGPAAGGCRMWPYASAGEALGDVLRLSRGMSYKNAVADLPLGGGKAVVIGDPRRDKTPERWRAFGRFIAGLNGDYVTAEDVGTTLDDMRLIAETTRHVAGLPEGEFASGDPSPITASGVFRGIEIAVRRVLSRDDLRGTRIAVQGLGNVGLSLSRRLAAEGAEIVACDLDEGRCTAAAGELPLRIVEADEIYDQDVDVFAPCALGGILNGETIPRLKARIVAGGANNQLADEAAGRGLAARGIFYVPDYVINGGGIISVASEIGRISDRSWVTRKLDALMATLEEIVERAVRTGEPAYELADRLALERLVPRASPASAGAQP